MPNKPPNDLNTLAIEALNLWQEHLASLAADPKAKSDLAQFIEPSRRLFAEWVEKVQATPHGTSPPFSTAGASTPDRTAPVQPASDDGAVRLAQLTLHVADLEKRVAKLESRRAAPAAKPANASGQRRRP